MAPVRREERATYNFSVLLFQRPVAFVGVREGLLDGILTLLEHCVSQVSDFWWFFRVVFQDIYVVNVLSQVIDGNSSEKVTNEMNMCSFNSS